MCVDARGEEPRRTGFDCRASTRWAGQAAVAEASAEDFVCLFVFDLDHHSSAGKIELVVVGKWNEEKGERLEHIGAGAFTFGRWRFIRIEYRQRPAGTARWKATCASAVSTAHAFSRADGKAPGAWKRASLRSDWWCA